MPPLPLLLLLIISSSWSLVLAGITISHLPGFNGPLPFKLETGYVTVDEVNDSQMFYHFIESEKSPSDDPVLLWLAGGPGCSGLTGIALDIGPLKFVRVEYNGSLPTLKFHPYSWTKVSNIIFLDSPIGAGFSFSRSSSGYEAGDSVTSKHIHTFLLKWFIDHPQFVPNPLYIAGDSYGGKVVPIVSHLISEGLESGQLPFLNLKGYIIGNPATGESIDVTSRVPYAHGAGILSDELFELTEKSCRGDNFEYPTGVECASAGAVVKKVKVITHLFLQKTVLFELISRTLQFFSEIDMDYILDPKCPVTMPKPKVTKKDSRFLKETHITFLNPPNVPSLTCKSYAGYLSYYWANYKRTRAALHVQEGTVGEWIRCNHEYPYKSDVSSTIKYHLTLTSRGYRALVYSGDHDLTVPFLGTKEWIKSLNYSVIDDWRSWHVGGQVAGYTRTYSNNLTFATVRGAGHTAPTFRPKECLAMLKRWISHEPL